MVIVFVFTFLYVDIPIQLVHLGVAGVSFVTYFVASCVHYTGGLTRTGYETKIHLMIATDVLLL